MSHRVLEADRHPTGHPLEVILYKLELLTCRKLRLDHVEQHGSRENRPAEKILSSNIDCLLFKPVDHGVVWLTIGIESNLIVPSSAGLLPHELTHALGAQVGQARKGALTGLKLDFT